MYYWNELFVTKHKQNNLFLSLTDFCIQLIIMAYKTSKNYTAILYYLPCRLPTRVLSHPLSNDIVQDASVVVVQGRSPGQVDRSGVEGHDQRSTGR